MMHVLLRPRNRASNPASLSATFVIAAAAWTLFAGPSAVHAQTQTDCGRDGYRVLARRWDAVLQRGWESRQACEHPDWPLRMVAITSGDGGTIPPGRAMSPVRITEPAPEKMEQPLLVKAGDSVRVWMQDESVRIEMTGLVERSAHRGEHVIVQITRRDDESGLTVQRIAGTVSGTEEVEMER
jgi:hypothetical protein